MCECHAWRMLQVHKWMHGVLHDPGWTNACMGHRVRALACNVVLRASMDSATSSAFCQPFVPPTSFYSSLTPCLPQLLRLP